MASSRSESFFEELKDKFPSVMEELNLLTPPCGFPVYSSMDVRDAGWKLCAVDVNLFPAGFNILSPGDRSRGATRFREFFSAKLLVPGPWKITVVPEAHTNNAGYLENLTGIIGLLKEAGCEVKLLWPGEPIPKPWTIKVRNGQELTYLPAEEALQGAQALLLNHDLSGGIPKAIQNVNLPTFPSTRLGWYRRRKSNHQEIVEALLKKLQQRLPFFDPWYFSVRTHMVAKVDFDSEASREILAKEVETMIETLKRDYSERGVEETPRIFVKNDAGTYGMGVLSVETPSQLIEAARNFKNKMKKGKESVPITQVIIQEAVPTAFMYSGTAQDPLAAVAGEPTIYMVNGIPIGGFMRIHEQLGPNARWENLNQPGSLLEALDCQFTTGQVRPFPKPRDRTPCEHLGLEQDYRFITKLHAAAAGLEDCPG